MNTSDLSLSGTVDEPPREVSVDTAPEVDLEAGPGTHNEIPLAVLPEIELRVLQGPQAGCRLALGPDQAYSLGTSDDCSVVLVGQNVQPEHARLTVQADMFEITPVQGSVRIDGIELKDGPESWELGSVFLVGRVVLCVDRTDAPWPAEETIVASAAQALLAPTEPDIASDDASDGDGPDPDHDDDLDDDESQDDDDSHEDADPDVDDPESLPLIGNDAPDHPRAAAATAAAGPGKHPGMAPSLLAASGLVLVGAAALALGIGWGPAPAVQSAASPALVPPVTSLPAPSSGEQAPPPTPGPADTPARPEPTTPPPEQVAARLERLVQQLRSPGHLSARWILDSQGPRVRIAGIDPTRLEAARARIEAARAETGPVEVELLEPADIAARFREALQASNLQRKFTVDPTDPNQLTYKASLTMEDVPVWEKLFLSFTEAHGNVPPVTVQVSTDLDRLSSRIGSVVGGSFPYIVTPEGQRIAPGGSLMGRTVTSVQIGEIVFADGVRYRFTP